MYNTVFNKKGISMIEVALAIFILMVGIVGVISIQSQSWRTTRTSDYQGRAAQILSKELEDNQAQIMNCCLALPVSGTETVYSSGGSSSVSATVLDVPFTVQTTITNIATGIWNVKAKVTWTGNTTGISETRTVSTQESFRSPASCTCAH
ncbi:MAG TPA: hypothetical protein DHV16_04235 [Nitrospiraceae bacterium]|nr:MAG: hypothetical protein A2Z82_10240 [Nitrospirae bacterium GWA2_46_11]OGW23171.1 MAG: hypothetical protein A2X55_09365 [Nitrospirae bacterium GWB2_47_37]HAK87721.1 hypothetical protein [Nitrospiraceae bacterium]HCZ11462.1 hypothetical protein [Nitrospiraceae bacterium]